MSRTVVLGANGQLGTDLCTALQRTGGSFVPLTHRDVDVRDHERINQLLHALRPSVVINTAAFHNVEACERDPEMAFAVNSHALWNLAAVCQVIDARLVQISTDYVFGGERRIAYGEDATPDPVNVYGVSKVVGERFVRALCDEHLIVRVSGLFGLAGASGKGGNFVETMLKRGQERGEVTVVTDQVLSPTSAADAAEKIIQLVDRAARGVYHVTNAGSCSWHDFAQAIFREAKLPVTVHPSTTAEMGSSVQRPGYSVLASARLSSEGLGALRHWKDALADYLHTRAKQRLPAAA